MRKFIVLLLAISLSCSVVFADSEDTSEDSQSSDATPITYVKQTIEGTTLAASTINATTKSITDLYNLVYDIWYNTAGSSPVNEVVTMRRAIVEMDRYVADIKAGTDKLADILNADYDNIGISLYDMLTSWLSIIEDDMLLVDSSDDKLSLAEILLVMDTHIDDLETYEYSISQGVGTANSNLSSIYSEINNFRSNQASDMDDVLSFITDYRDLFMNTESYQAKEDQQDYEDAAISDFTGDGDAAASISDIGNMKSVSSTIKSGLQSGGSVSNGLAPFSTSSGFWEWFTQSNSDNINSPSSGAEVTRSVPDFYAQYNSRKSLNNAPDVIDFYSGNHDQLMDLFEGNER